MREVRGLRNTLYSSKFAVSLPLKFCSFAKFFSHAKSCAPCAKAKAVSLLTQIGHGQRPGRKQSGGPRPGRRSNKWTQSGRRKFRGS